MSNEGLEELRDILGSRPDLEMGIRPYPDALTSRLWIHYTFPTCPENKGRVRITIDSNAESDLYYVQFHASRHYPALYGWEPLNHLLWDKVLEVALSVVRLWEDILRLPPEPTFRMQLLTGQYTVKDSVLHMLKSFILKAHQKGERSIPWYETVGGGVETIHAHFAVEELERLLDMTVSCEVTGEGRYTWHFSW